MKLRPSSNTILGAVIGDIIGSVYEWDNAGRYDFDIFPDEAFFTDDTVLTLAVADSILTGKDYGQNLWKYGRAYPGRGYGGRFEGWLASENPQPYNSFGNGAGMRVSPVGFAFDTIEAVLEEAEQTALPSHNHPEGIKGAQAVAAVIFLTRTGHSKDYVRDYVEKIFNYDLNFTIDENQADYQFSEICQESVPESIVAFLESGDFEDAIRRAVFLGGDSDTIACMAGGMAAAAYTIPPEFIDFADAVLDPELKGIINRFDEKFGK